jgi:hypothetical protein
MQNDMSAMPVTVESGVKGREELKKVKEEPREHL